MDRVLLTLDDDARARVGPALRRIRALGGDADPDSLRRFLWRELPAERTAEPHGQHEVA